MAPAHRLPVTASQVLARSRSPYVSKTCRSRLQTTPVSNVHQIRHSTGNPVLDKVRKMIWGTDNPPGAPDPYGPGFRERRRMALEQQRRRANPSPEEREAEDVAQRQDRHPASAGPRDFEVEHDGEFEDDPIFTPVPEYKPAETWDGLEHVGHKGHWQDVAPTRGDKYNAWLTPTSELALSRDQLVQLLHRAVVEQLSSSQDETVTPRYYATEQPSGLVIVLAEDGGLERVEESETADDATPPNQSVDETFLTAKLDFTNALTFKILKHFQTLTSTRLSDPAISTLSRHPQPLIGLLDHILDLQKPRPKNLYQKLAEQEHLQSQSNLMILPRRETPVDKEKEVGRWKVIEQELRERGLPVLGKLSAR